MKKDIQFKTFGCRLNSYETEVMQNLSQKSADKNFTVINTCAVTNEAIRKAKQAIRKLKITNPTNKIFVTGCASQIEPKTFLDMPQVDKVFGNVEKLNPSFWKDVTDTHKSLEITNIMNERTIHNHRIQGIGSRARAYVQVQNGCDHRCTFCIIPFGRGNSRSVEIELVVEQIKSLVKRGFKEVVLTGVDITSWGTDLPGTPKLSRLIRDILKSNRTLERLRLSSIDQIELDTEFFEILANEQQVMPHFHLSLQSGDNMILKRMKRRHNRESTIEFCNKIRSIRSNVTLGADIIVGFPTETEDMFENSINLVDECNLTWLHVFPFSPRTGTPAARMPQLEKKIINERAALLRKKGELQNIIHNKTLAGKKRLLLMETSGLGRTECFTKVQINDDIKSGSIVNVQIHEQHKNMDSKILNGEVVI